ncbi:hypothetical protein [Nonomuraea dietziae]|uniref:hypothetical protein n=1 Tax=Nonomuraea dietziae TaxID=65515 RepID=UPI00341B66A2
MATRQMTPEMTDEDDVIDRLALLRGAVTAHARSEERYEFPQLRARTTEAERRKLAGKVKAAEDR